MPTDWAPDPGQVCARGSTYVLEAAAEEWSRTAKKGDGFGALMGTVRNHQ